MFSCSHLLEQVQEVCDTVGIIFNGKMVQQGSLSELTSVDTHTELLVEGMDRATLAKVRELIERDGGKLISSGAPRKSLENLFIEIANDCGEEAR